MLTIESTDISAMLLFPPEKDQKSAIATFEVGTTARINMVHLFSKCSKDECCDATSSTQIM